MSAETTAAAVRRATRFTVPVPVPAGTPLPTRVSLKMLWLETLQGETEWPPDSNLGPLPDALADDLGEPRGCAWCARLGGYANKHFGLWVPPEDVGDCDAWRYHGEQAGLWRSAGLVDLSSAASAPVGAIALYTSWTRLTVGRYAVAHHFDAVHLGTLAGFDAQRVRLNVEGNGSSADFDANGGCVVKKPVHKARLYGLILPAVAA